MAIECTAYQDGKGGLHANPTKATLEDLANVLGRVGDEGGMTAGVARLIFDKRREIERVFAEHDLLVSQRPDDCGATVRSIARPATEGRCAVGE